MDFSQALASVRRCKSLKLAELGRLSGISVGHLSRLEKGDRNPSEDVVRRIAAALDADTGEKRLLLESAGYEPKGEQSGSVVHGFGSELQQREWPKRFQVACSRLLAARNFTAGNEVDSALASALCALESIRHSLECPVREAIVPLAGGQHRLLAPHAIQRLMMIAAAEAFATGIPRIIFVLAPASVEPIFGPLESAFRLLSPGYWQLTCTEQTQPTGLGDAILAGSACISANANKFAVMLPDDVIHRSLAETERDDLSNMIELGQDEQCDAVIAGIRLPRSLRHGGVAVLADDRVRNRVWPVVQLVEKPGPNHPALATPHAATLVGRYILSTKIFDHLRKLKTTTANKLELTDAIEDLRISGGKVLTWLIEGERIDLGLSLDAANQAVLLE